MFSLTMFISREDIFSSLVTHVTCMNTEPCMVTVEHMMCLCMLCALCVCLIVSGRERGEELLVGLANIA